MDRKTFIFSSVTMLLGGSIFARDTKGKDMKKSLVVYFSWSGNTRSIAKKITELVNADIFELETERPYSRNYNTCLDEALRDQKAQARPALKKLPNALSEYDTVFLGYPNWWGSIPMPVATFLEKSNLKKKEIIPFCSNGGGGLGKSVSAIAKLCPDSKIKEALSVYYAGGNSLSKDVSAWLVKNAIPAK